jgi:hypothetical protein
MPEILEVDEVSMEECKVVVEKETSSNNIKIQRHPEPIHVPEKGMNPNSPKTEENLFKTANEELKEETKKVVEPQQRYKTRVFDANADPVPIRSPINQQ